MLLDLDIETKLRADLERARERFRKSTDEFDLIVRGARSGMYGANECLRIQQTGNEGRIAMAEFEYALVMYVDYVLNRKLRHSR